MKKKKTRKENHETGAKFAQKTADCIAIRTGADHKNRGGSRAIIWKPGDKTDKTKRNAPEYHDQHPHGLDGYLHYKGRVQRVSILTNYDWTRERWTFDQVMRVTAFRSGIPKVKDVWEDYEHITLVQGYFFDHDQEEPYMIKIAKAVDFLKVGEGAGFIFPKHKGRLATVHFLTNALATVYYADIPGMKRPPEHDNSKTAWPKGAGPDHQKLTLDRLVDKILS